MPKPVKSIRHTAYLSPTVLAKLVRETLLNPQLSGPITAGEIGLPVQSDGKTLPCGIYARWHTSAGILPAPRRSDPNSRVTGRGKKGSALLKRALCAV